MIRKRVTAAGKTRYAASLDGLPQRTFDTAREAREYEAKLRKDRQRHRAGLDVDKAAITYDGLCELFLKGYTARSKEWTTTMLRYSRAKWGKVWVRQLEPEMIGPWLNALTDRFDQPLAPKTKHHILERMRAVCEMGVEWGYLSRSPVRSRAVGSPGQERERAIRPFESWVDVERFAAVMGDQHAPWSSLIRFVCATGMRPGEWQALDWLHIDRAANEVNVPGTKNANAVRQVPLTDMAIAALDDLPSPLRPSQPIFTTKTGKPLRGANYEYWRKNHWRLALLDAGFEHREVYEMRHTFATVALQAGVPLDVVSKLMGHASVEVTRRFYAKYTRTTLHMYLPLLNRIGDTDERRERQRV